ncbi:hypothetical protein SAMD00019534_104710 [Acytostelium subglobosum LB1]|uniref:hypothetical protein n=1 Tax=Acytostelium subglobosum LB1 TaxID=1410327 RepID=UPI000644E538|nr:hypothetical protein SAMD00019534_104710 [Acytostelium subglobosum LB1]GAM27296.1 hypothetical protein SAMD00019534_104710 [Acytostelium subglobosum LB1]|eukprot:XP_012749763.1 hypothetical protein SAMD00019534_104710 [Acytostelium subglobosum LB1]
MSLQPFGKKNKYSQVDVAIGFLHHCYNGDFANSLKYISMMNDPKQVEQIFNSCYRVGSFKYIKSATALRGNGHVYVIAQHESDEYQWIFYVDKTIRGWDQRMNGSYRQPNENGQQVQEVLHNTEVKQPTASMMRLASSPQAAAPKNRVIRFHWTTPLSSRDLNSNGTFELLMPPNRPFQRHIKFNVITPNITLERAYHINGNTYLVLRPKSNSTSSFLGGLFGSLSTSHVEYTLDIEFNPNRLQTSGYGDQLAEWYPNDDPRQYLGVTDHTSARIDPHHPRIQQIVRSILEGKQHLDVIGKAKAIATWVGQIPYEIPKPGMPWPTLEQYLQSNFRYCECGGHALFFVMLSRAAGIPARRLFHPWIVSHRGERFERFDSHCIAEFYEAKHGWVPVDATGAFSDTNAEQWMRVPMSNPKTWPTGLTMTVESQDGKELRAINAKHNRTLQDCKVMFLS